MSESVSIADPYNLRFGVHVEALARTCPVQVYGEAVFEQPADFVFVANPICSADRYRCAVVEWTKEILCNSVGSECSVGVRETGSDSPAAADVVGGADPEDVLVPPRERLC